MTASPELLKFFAKYIEGQIGIVYSDNNFFQLEHRLNDIVSLMGCRDLDELWKRARTSIDGQMRELLLDLATNNETSFFRDSAIFLALTRDMVPEVVKRYPSLGRVKIWSAASSTGQEAYSIAMSIDQARKTNLAIPDFDIFVSDYSERVLARAREGLYTQLEVQRGLPAKLLIEYFKNEGTNQWRIDRKVQSHMQYKQINLLDPFPLNLGPFDIIFCRNVLIYQSVDNKRMVIERMLKLLNPYGFLVLGSAESMIGLSDQVQQMQYGTAVVYQKKS